MKILITNILSIVYYMSVSLTNSKEIIANSVSVINEHKVIDLKELF